MIGPNLTSTDIISKNRGCVEPDSLAIEHDHREAGLGQSLGGAYLVAARHPNDPFGAMSNQGVDPLLFALWIFLGVGEQYLIVGAGCKNLDTPDDIGKKARGDVGHHDSDEAGLLTPQSGRGSVG